MNAGMFILLFNYKKDSHNENHEKDSKGNDKGRDARSHSGNGTES